MLRITRNAALDRKRKDARATPLDDEGLAMIESAGPSPASAPAGFRVEDRTRTADDPAHAIEDNELVALVWESAAALGARDAEILDLGLRHGMSPAEIGETVGMNRNAANQAVHRARNRLKTAVEARVLWRSGEPVCAGLAAALEHRRGPPLRTRGRARHDAPRREVRRVPGAASDPARTERDVRSAAVPRGAVAAQDEGRTRTERVRCADGRVRDDRGTRPRRVAQGSPPPAPEGAGRGRARRRRRVRGGRCVRRPGRRGQGPGRRRTEGRHDDDGRGDHHVDGVPVVAPTDLPSTTTATTKPVVFVPPPPTGHPRPRRPRPGPRSISVTPSRVATNYRDPVVLDRRLQLVGDGTALLARARRAGARRSSLDPARCTRSWCVARAGKCSRSRARLRHVAQDRGV